ncbi:ATP-binding protein [Sphingomonas oleivorans]|nr:ATP-binding protein [Sphingomonas oleivorans]
MPPVSAAGQNGTAIPPPLPKPGTAADPRRSAVLSAFNATRPVDRRKDLHGRDDKLELLFDAVLDRDHHAVIHGARGSGKTSLVRVFSDYADQCGAVMVYMACEERSSFAELLRPYLKFIPPSCVPMGEEQAFQDEVAALEEDFGPRALVQLLSRLHDCQLILILDEFDRVTNRAVQSEVATFMKLLSDALVPVQLAIVGIARSVTDVISCHPSLRRHLSAIPIGRIAAEDVRTLIDQGAQSCGLAFDEDSRSLISSLSCGSPYHIRLFCNYAGLKAVKSDAQGVDATIAIAGILDATDNWARLNEEDHSLFIRLVRADQPVRDALAAVARMAAQEDAIDIARLERQAGEAAGDALHLLADALMPDGGEEGRLTFKDSIAPQFLLVLLAEADAALQSRPEATRPLALSRPHQGPRMGGAVA